MDRESEVFSAFTEYYSNILVFSFAIMDLGLVTVLTYEQANFNI
ncbi:hypothetical protein LEP1GSC195_0180 [Leptospira wolbachii serovar Codice str. CDC]|uniref:Uncharacterized protein n=1 Tax=Leptospira wolbachii serovar Codice str. CDC TaxID=1218599 RepID=R9A6A2_9LEPT|nr:hypothetical protein LEP1GSC195_0180 [Leptospira wolbachii serovar Codice str. CDC]